MLYLNKIRPLLLIGALAISTALFFAPAAFAGGLCGNAYLDANEQCDDGNLVAGDGCSRICQIEQGYQCTSPHIPLSPDNVVRDPGFEQGQSSNFWIDESQVQLPNLCNLLDCPNGPGPRYGAHWAQVGAAPDNLFWRILQYNITIPEGPSYLRFDVINAQCAEPQTPDFFYVTMNEVVMWSSDTFDAECTGPEGSYRSVTIDLTTAPQGPWGGADVKLAIVADTISGESIRGFDNFQISKQLSDPVPSICTLDYKVQYYQPFENIGGPLGSPGFFQNLIGDIQLKWGTTDDGLCGTGDSPPGNHTGEPGAAACIDSTFFRRQVNAVESYVCADPLDLRYRTGNELYFVVNYQPGSVTTEDFFAIWVDTTPFLGPINAGINNTVFFSNTAIGSFGQSPGVAHTVEIGAMDGEPEVYVCFGYGNDNQGYAQVDTVVLSAGGCIDDFEEDKLDSCIDNCINLPNPMQIDSDNDGYGNGCDADIARQPNPAEDEPANGNDCLTNFLDFTVLIEAMFSLPTHENWNPDADLNSDNAVNFGDVARFAQLFLKAPGPSGFTTTCGVSGGTE